MSDWLKLTLRVAPERAETLCAELWSLGTVGLEEREHEGARLVDAFFSASDRLPAEAREPEKAFWVPFGAVLECVEVLPDQDWIEPYRQLSRPFPIGRGFLVDPREPGLPGERIRDDRTVLRIPARRAFGIGSHESTRLLVEWLEDVELSGRRVLDVGTGTGILAFVALRRGALSLMAVDRDVAAAFAARENQRLNGCAFPVAAGGIGALGPGSRFDLALVNVLPENIEPELETLRGHLVEGGEALFSGILASVGPRWADRLEAAGFIIVERRTAGEWEAWMTRRRLE